MTICQKFKSLVIFIIPSQFWSFFQSRKASTSTQEDTSQDNNIRQDGVGDEETSTQLSETTSITSLDSSESEESNIDNMMNAERDILGEEILSSLGSPHKISHRSDDEPCDDPSPLFIKAVIDGNLPELRDLLCHGVNINVRDSKDGWTALMWACCFQKTDESSREMIKLLLQHGADPLIEDGFKNNALLWAASTGNVEHIDMLIKNSNQIDINTQNSEGRTALMLAAENGKVEMVSYCLEQRARVDLKNNEGNTALICACTQPPEENVIEIVKLLLSNASCCCVTQENNVKYNVLLSATRSGNIELVHAILNHSSHLDVNSTNSQGITPLMLAAKLGDEKMIRYLLSRNADVNLQNCYGETALTLAQQFAALKSQNAMLRLQSLLIKSSFLHEDSNPTPVLNHNMAPQSDLSPLTAVAITQPLNHSITKP